MPAVSRKHATESRQPTCVEACVFREVHAAGAEAFPVCASAGAAFVRMAKRGVFAAVMGPGVVHADRIGAARQSSGRRAVGTGPLQLFLAVAYPPLPT